MSSSDEKSLLDRKVTEGTFTIISPVLDPDEESEWLVSDGNEVIPAVVADQDFLQAVKDGKGDLRQWMRHRLPAGSDPVADHGRGQVQLRAEPHNGDHFAPGVGEKRGNPTSRGRGRNGQRREPKRMSDATWKIRHRKNGPQPVSWEDTSDQDQFELLVTAKSEHRPGIVHQWRGRINVDETGNQNIRTISLVKTSRANDPNEANDPNVANEANDANDANEANVADVADVANEANDANVANVADVANEANDANEANEETSVQQISLYKIMNTTDDAATVFTKIANFCDKFTQDMERNLVEREKREQKAMEQVSTALRRLTELEDEGIHNVASYGERTEEGAERWKTSTDTN